MKLRLLDLFSGIGGFSLGLQRSGAFETVAFCEADKKCRKRLSELWPKVPIYDDVRTLSAERLRADGITVDAICGGFPCQDVSLAGKRELLKGARSGLWSEQSRLAGEIRPEVIFVENTTGLLSGGMGTVLRDLAALGYDAEWHCIPASYVGAPHERDRVWIVAYPSRDRYEANPSAGWGAQAARILADIDLSGRLEQRRPVSTFAEYASVECCRQWSFEPDVGGDFHGFSSWLDGFNLSGTIEEINNNAKAFEMRPSEILLSLRGRDLEEAVRGAFGGHGGLFKKEILLSFLRKLEDWSVDEPRLQLEGEAPSENGMRGVRPYGKPSGSPRGPRQEEQCSRKYSDAMQTLSRFLAHRAEEAWARYRWENAKTLQDRWALIAEKGISPTVYGLPGRVDRLHQLGNAVIPQIPEMLGRSVMRSRQLAEFDALWSGSDE